jgi:hypothetical protein
MPALPTALASVLRPLVLIVAASVAAPAAAWIYPEHRDITLIAVQRLDPERKLVFDRFWLQARAGAEQRLCVQAADAAQGLTPECIDWAALPAISGDHSCSSADLIVSVQSNWILQVADIAAQLKLDLARIPVTAPSEQPQGAPSAIDVARRRLADETSRAARLNALRTADTRIQRVDSQYATRADSNLAHFVLPRPDTNLDPFAHAQLAYAPGSELNAAGVYAWFHLQALQKAVRLAHEPNLPGKERQALIRSMLFDEAFAVHFLQDMFASGHVAGSWGDVSQRKGTHDFYNQNGLEVFTWIGRDRTIVLMGDAHMRLEDAELTASAVRISLEQVLDAATGRPRGPDVLPYTPQASLEPEAFDVCRSKTFPARAAPPPGAGPPPYRTALSEVLLPTPVPGLGPGLGAQPRSRSEVGVFMGLAGSIDLRGVSGGYIAGQNDPGLVAGLDLAFRIGVGLEGALGDAGDGLVYAQLGFRADTPSTNKYEAGGLASRIDGNLSAAIPALSGPSIRVRMPYYLVPFDLLFLSPMYFFNPERYTQLGITAVNGGLLGWQQGWATSIGRFQFVLGREVGVALYGLGGKAQILAPYYRADGLPEVVNIKSTYIDVPIFEYRPFRSFSNNQSSSVIFQVFGGLQVPYGASMVNPAVPLPEFQNVWSIGLRMVFDWRYYR